ncbi:MAG: nitronate monooxygenase [Planctomycetales bacterium]|nr:nitronate monooxygenase [Planctomycetales bacterium]
MAGQRAMKDAVREQANYPQLIQGGMGVAVSSWRLARAVGCQGQLGVVSGTALDTVLVRRLELGDPDGELKLAFDEFPFPKMAERVWDKYFIDGGKDADAPFSPVMALTERPKREHVERVVLANFVEVFLAKRGHRGPIGINLLEKIQTPTLASLYGAMLADVDYVLMGAGIPRAIPGVLDRFSDGESAELPLLVEGAEAGEHHCVAFSPEEFTEGEVPWLRRPRFLAIVSSGTLATMLARKSNGRVDGFIVEGHSAGGHNALPRGGLKLDPNGEPIYGPRDEPELATFRELGLPFWLAGTYGSAEHLNAALKSGAAGIQVGTAFAFCEESGIEPELKRRVIALSVAGQTDVRTDPAASPTGFPFKVLALSGSLSEQEVAEARTRRCDLGYLRQAYRRPDGRIGWRCPGEPVEQYVRKGGQLTDTVGRKCICNGLMSTVDLAQCHAGELEPPIITCGNDVANIWRFLPTEKASSYSAQDVIARLLNSPIEVQAPLASAR